MNHSGEHTPKTVRQLLEKATGQLKRAGVGDARLNAELLLAHTLGVDRSALFARPNAAVPNPVAHRMQALTRRRAAREPLQYLLGSWEFYGRTFEVTPAVMVPRQETELLVEKCLEKLPADGHGPAADLGTGSGIVGVTLAAERPRLRVVATDSSAPALAVARRNAHRHGVAGRISFVRADLSAGLRSEAFALVVSNPPYVPGSEIDGLEPEVSRHEPRRALDGGPDGLEVVRRLVPQAGRALRGGGWLALELGPRQWERVRRMTLECGCFDMETAECVTDPAGCDRVFCIRKRAG